MFTKEESHSFLIYPEQINKARAKLNNDQFGLLFGALLDYATNKEVYQEDPIVSAYFDLITHTLDIDNRKYQKRVDYRRENGKKGGRPKKEKTTTKKVSITKEKNYTEKEIVAFKKETLDMLNDDEIIILNDALTTITSLTNEDLKIMSDKSKDSVYKSIRAHIRKVENIYSTASVKSKNTADEITKALHEKASKKQRTTKQKYEDFWDDYESKVFIYDGEELYVDGNSYEIVLNKDRSKKPIENESKIIMEVINENVDFIN